jgi:hypothetical protein
VKSLVSAMSTDMLGAGTCNTRVLYVPRESSAGWAAEAAETASRSGKASSIRLRHVAAVMRASRLLTYCWHGQMASIAPRSNVAGRVDGRCRGDEKRSIIALMLR